MKIKKQGYSITIDDNSEEAVKIKRGNKFELLNGNLKVYNSLDPSSIYYKIKQIEESDNWVQAKPFLIDILNNL